MNRPEALLEREILRRFGREPDVLLCKNEVGFGYTSGAVKQATAMMVARFGQLPRDVLAVLHRGKITFGLGVGSPDLALWVGGQSSLVELKSDVGTLSEEQKTWHAAGRERGVRIDVARTVEAFEGIVEELRARRGSAT